MRLQSNLVLGIAIGFLSTSWLGCSDSQSSPDPKNGTAGENGSSFAGATGSQFGSGGSAASGGTVGSAGQTAGSAGSSGTAGVPAAGTTATSGGSTVTGGTTISGGIAAGGTTGGRPDAGPATTGGRTGNGGTTAVGGATGRGGSTATGGASGTGVSTATGGAALPKGGAPGGTSYPAKFVGNIDTRGQVRSDFNKYWNQFSPENAGKWGTVQGGGQSSYNWGVLDAAYKAANTAETRMVFKHHCFVWGSQQPTWTDSLTTANGPTAVQTWMKAVCTRYPNVDIIDVVNEPPPHTTPKYANAIGGGTNSTWDWIANAFKWAREACPNATLVLNDYNNDELSGDAQHTIDIVTAIKKLGAPIDAVGCQTHGASNAPASTLKTNIDKIASATSLPIFITEYDIAQADDNKQLTQYKDHFTMFMSNNNVKGITIWGYLVGATWVANTGILKTDGTPRPALTWLMSFLGR
jgi:endo-1,4-beta-xylanase